MTIQDMKWPVEYIKSLVLMLCAFCLSALIGVPLLAMIVTAVFAYLMVFSDIDRSWIPVSVVLLLMVQNLIIGFFGHMSGQFDQLTLLTQIPFVYLFLLFCLFLVIGEIRFSIVTFMVLLLVICILMSSLRGSTLSEMIYQTRNMITAYLAFEVGRTCLKERSQLITFAKNMVAMGLIMFVSGITFLIGKFPLYKVFGIENVYFAKGTLNEGVYELPPRFTTEVFNIPITRMGSLYYEPVTVSYFFAACILCAVFVKWTNSRILRASVTIILVIGLLLSGGKGGMLTLGIMIVAFILCLILNFLPGINFKLGFWISVAAMMAGVTLFSEFYSINYAGPAKAHFDTIRETTETIALNPMGYGLGVGGFNGGNSHTYTESGGESALMAVGYQIGVQGVISFALVFITMSMKLLSRSLLVGKRYVMMSCFIPVAILGVSIFQLNTLTPQGCVPLFLLATALYGKDLGENDEK
ncbi:hypothetical protein [Weissella sp. MSCH1]|uniref:hypothetical protein n=1 Tax=Weissella sp. MSCH1 TaxID=3383343 RepID=UPI003896F008